MNTAFRSIRPKSDEHLTYYAKYIDRVPDGDIIETLRKDTLETLQFLRSIPESKLDYRYAPGKWSIRQVVGHIADGERVFQYRAWRFSRADSTSVPGFDENLYVDNAPFENVSMSDLIGEFENLRQASIHLYSNMTEEMMARRGLANGAEVSVRAIAYIIAGHVSHHVQLLKDRYL